MLLGQEGREFFLKSSGFSNYAEEHKLFQITWMIGRAKLGSLHCFQPHQLGISYNINLSFESIYFRFFLSIFPHQKVNDHSPRCSFSKNFLAKNCSLLCENWLDLSDKLDIPENWKELLGIKWFVSLTFPIILHILNKRIEIWCWKATSEINSCSQFEKARKSSWSGT